MRTVWIASLVVAFTACKKEREPPSSASLLAPASGSPPAAAAPPPVSSTTPPALLPMGVTWEDPPGWERVGKSNPMRKATYRIPRAAGDGEDAELAVFYFGPGQGGSIEANVDRWVKQFSDVPDGGVRRADRSAHGLRQHTVEIDKGTFSSGMPGGPTRPKPGFALLGGIVEAPTGVYFFKMTGPSATVKAARPAFYQLLDSVKPS
ncbi:MAG TPA: hypothetical protein VKY73_04700 [Polyangiaceae bacterium]|nr:hypothetical protein [Polyangiaceae bacterium]